MIAISVRTQSSLHPQIFRGCLPRCSTTSKATLPPWTRPLEPAFRTALICTNTSLPPRAGAIKPSPFETLNHLTVPLGAFDLRLIRAPRRSPWQLLRIYLIAFQAAKHSRPLTVNRHHQHHQATAVLASPRSIGL